ncbi:Avr9/Cf-9 rapidly elicited protein [Hirschfeldia incana]|nr:Avr9/Cf-9 rapidly elicited protein [Hirschfeldia incana]
MEIKVQPKALESEIIANKVVEDDMKKMKECVLVGQAADEDIAKEQATMKIMEVGLRHNSDEAKQDQDHTKSDSRLSSSSLEMIKKLENDTNSSKNSENTKNEEEKKKENNNMKHKKASSHVWDCGSSLYDSFELNSFKRQLDSAISASSARTMSMSHLPDRRLPLLDSLSPESPIPPPPVTSCSSSGNKKHSNKISRSLQRFLKSVFRPKHHQTLSSSSSTPSSPVYKGAGHGGVGDKDRYYVVYDKSGSLTTIPESTEKEVGPEINSLVRKTVSERFPASRVAGISCA